MKLNDMTFAGGRPVDGYGPGFFRVGGEVREGAVLLLPSGVSAWGGYAELAPVLDAADAIDVLFVGTGAEIGYLPTDMRSLLEASGIGVEVMASPAACRTYNVLLSEGRRIGAALLPV